MSVTLAPAGVVILDYGAQYSQLIARRAREANVFSELLPYDTAWDEIAKRNPAAIILTGGPESTLEAGAPGLDPGVLASGLPILGICYGMQLLARDLGGTLVPLAHREFGPAQLDVDAHESTLFDGIPANLRVWMSHGDSVERVPEGFAPLAHTARCAVAAMGDERRKIFGVQFHPEVVHSEFGTRLIGNFLHKVAGIVGAWEIDAFVERSVAEIRAQVGEQNVICALSGGVNSAVVTLVARAIGKKFTRDFVDTPQSIGAVLAAFRRVALHASPRSD